MKGLYIINTDIRNPRAHTSQVLNTLAALSEKISIELVAPRYSGNYDIEGLKIIHGLSRVPSVTLARVFGIKSASVFAFVLFNISAMFVCMRRKISRDVDFVYLRSPFFFPLAVFARMVRIPLFYETHRVPMSGGERIRDYFMCKLASGVVVISEELKRSYIQYDKPILVAHDGVSLARFAGPISQNEAREKLGLSISEKICVYAGTVSALKGVHYIVQVAQKLPEVKFFLVGQALPEIMAMDKTQNVFLLGKKEQSQLPAYLAMADLLLIPHPNNGYSQSPMKLFEYMASGVPIVSSRLPSVSEILNDKNSILVEPDSVESLFDGIQKILNDQELASTIAKRAVLDVKNYTWEKRGERMANFIQKNLGNIVE